MIVYGGVSERKNCSGAQSVETNARDFRWNQI